MKKKILFFSHKTIPFIRQDKEILEEEFNLVVFNMEYYQSRIKAISTYLKVIFWLLKNIRKADALFLRFADVYGFIFSVFARLFNKKLFVVVGGFDSTWVPELGYGTYHNKRSRFFTGFTFNTACKILPVSNSLVISNDSAYGFLKREEGIKRLYPKTDSDKIEVIPNGYKVDFFTAGDGSKLPNKVITVGSIHDYKTYKLKGIDVYLELAQSSPELDFYLIGADPDKIKNWGIVPTNFIALPYRNHSELLMHYQDAKVFMCLSLTGGMPNVLSESMLCECVPVGYRASAIPDIIGNTGIIIDHLDLDKIKENINAALQMDGKLARQRIIDLYSLETRKKRLHKILNDELA